jgi:hypothetical protein
MSTETHASLLPQTSDSQRTLLSKLLTAANEKLETVAITNGAARWSIRQSYTAVTAGTSRSKHFVTDDCVGPQLVFASIGDTANLEVKYQNPVEIKAALELSDGTILPLYFAGRRLAILRPGALLTTDPAEVRFAAGDTFWLRIFVNRLISTSYTDASGETGLLTATQTNWAYNTLWSDTWNSEGLYYTSSTGIDPFTYDRTDSGTITANAIGGLLPVAVVGKVLRSESSSVVVIGDSVAAGDNDVLITGQTYSGYGYIRRALTGQVPCVMLPQSGERARYWNDDTSTHPFFRAPMARYGRNILVALGYNDIVADGADVATVKTRLLTLWNRFAGQGLRVWGITYWPQTTSSDGWLTVANQTIADATENSRRIEINTWVRTLPAPLAGYFEIADAAESARDSGKWKAPETAALSGTSSAGTAFTLTDGTKSWTTNQWAGYVLRNITKGTISSISSNTATVLTTNNSGAAHAVGDSYQIAQIWTYDGIHPTAYGHDTLADAVNPTRFAA